MQYRRKEQTMCFVYFNSTRSITCLTIFIFCGLLYSIVFYFRNGRSTLENVSLDEVNIVDENVKTERSGTEKIEKNPERKKADESDVDLVYYWMNGSDPQFRETLLEYLQSIERKDSKLFALNRYNDFGTLKYSLRSVQQYANWFRHIFIVTNGQIPCWLNLNNPRITLATHVELFPNRSDLPTFSFQAVESHLFRIKGLSKRFVCMYDDIIFTSKVVLEDFVSRSGQFKVRFYSGDLQGCNKNCRAEDVNNGKCERSCYTERCEWDGDDCTGKNIVPDIENNEHVQFDSWKGSIMHTQFLFNKEFGPRNREIPRGGPHLYDKDIFKLLQDRFQDEWIKTSSYKIRHDKSINIQFAYYNFILENAILGSHNMSFLDIEITKCCGYTVLTIDNKDYLERKELLANTEKEIQLKKPQFLIIANKFHTCVNVEGIREIEKDLKENLFEKLFPVPSIYEV